MKHKAVILSTIAKVIAALMLLQALDRNPYDYYTILRWVVCGVAIYVTWLALVAEKVSWAWVYGIMAVMFNPIVPIHLNKQAWAPIDLAAAALMVISIFTVKPESEAP